MRLAKTRMKSFADFLVVAINDGAYERIGRSLSPSLSRESERFIHAHFIA
jgi:hypothetical protein